MFCFYHSADLDGHCSGAIAKLNDPELELRPYNYGDDFPWNEVEGQEVMFVDCSLQPFGYMLRLRDVTKRLVWIDHHKSALEEEAAHSEFKADGLRIDGEAGCELTWKFLHPDVDLPRAVYLLGRYDVWDHSDPDTLPFQYGMRLLDLRPKSEEQLQLWKRFIDNDSDVIKEQIYKGRVILDYETEQNKKVMGAQAFETEFFGLRAVVANRGLCSSQLFDSIWDPEKHDIMIPFYMKGDGTWLVSLYSTKDNVDCSEFAKKLGGGGHKGAAGFSVPSLTKLPFKVER